VTRKFSLIGSFNTNYGSCSVGFFTFGRIVIIHCVVFKLYSISHLHDYFFVFVLLVLATVNLY